MLTGVTSGWEEKKQLTFFSVLFARPTFCNTNMDSIGNKNNHNESYFIKRKRNGSWGNHWMLTYNICTLSSRHEVTEGAGRGGSYRLKANMLKESEV